MRIVSLLPSATEIVCELGLADELVGVSHDCDWPPAIRGKPVLSASQVDTDATSADIDRQVREQVHAGRSIYHLDQGELKRLAPDLILTQELCEVCAPSFDTVQRAARILDGEAQVVSLEPSSLEGILENIRLVGELSGRQDRAERLLAALRQRIDRVREGSRTADAAPRVLCLEWLDPLFLGGHWVPEMVELAGARTLGRAGEHSRETDWYEIEAFDPEVAVLMPCGFDLNRALREAETLTAQPSWQRLSAVTEGHVYAVDGSAYFNRPGPRAVTGLEIMARIVHPRLFAELELPTGALAALSHSRIEP